MIPGGDGTGVDPLKGLSFKLSFPSLPQTNQDNRRGVNAETSQFILSPRSLTHFPATIPLRADRFVSEGGNMGDENKKVEAEEGKKGKRIAGIMISLIVASAGIAIATKGSKDDNMALGWLGWGVGTAGFVGLAYFGTAY